jgi:multidrug resistance efflux pump
MLLDLYRKALPGQVSFVDKTAPGARSDDSSTDSVVVDQSPRRAVFEAIPDAAGDPRKQALDAAHAVTSARAAVAEAQVIVANSEKQLKRLESTEKGVIPQSKIIDTTNDLRRNQAAVEKLSIDLTIKERQLDDARETLSAQIKLREIDVADAKLRLEQAESEFSRATQLHEKHAIAKEQYEASRVAQRLAESQYQRAQLLLELYRKALPGQGASPDKVREEENKTSKKTSDARRPAEESSGGDTDGAFAEVPVGDFSFSNATATPGLTIHLDFKLAAKATSKQASSLDSQLKSHQAQVRQAVDKIVRTSSRDELNDPDLAKIKSLVRDDINRLLGNSDVVEVVITNVRTIEQ